MWKSETPMLRGKRITEQVARGVGFQGVGAAPAFEASMVEGGLHHFVEYDSSPKHAKMTTLSGRSRGAGVWQGER